MSVLYVKEDGQWKPIVTIKGDKGDPGSAEVVQYTGTMNDGYILFEANDTPIEFKDKNNYILVLDYEGTTIDNDTRVVIENEVPIRTLNNHSTDCTVATIAPSMVEDNGNYQWIINCYYNATDGALIVPGTVSNPAGYINKVLNILTPDEMMDVLTTGEYFGVKVEDGQIVMSSGGAGYISGLWKYVVNQDNSAEWVQASENSSLYDKLQDNILENPNLIQYTMDGGTLRILAGSVFSFPNGDKAKVTETLVHTITEDTTQIVFTDGTHLYHMDEGKVFTGAEAPTAGYDMMLWYDTTTNTIKYSGDNGATWDGNYAFPVAIGSISGIDVCFCDGIGYFANCLWVDDGVKVLIPNGKTSQGTFNNIEYTVETPIEVFYNDTIEGTLFLKNDGTVIVENQYTLGTDNFFRDNNNDIIYGCPIGTIDVETGRVVKLNKRKVLQIATTEDLEKYSSKYLGEVIFSLSLLDEPTLLLADGSTIQAGGTYDGFIDNYIEKVYATTPSLFCTNEEYEQSITNYGVCGKYVYNRGVSLRLPTLSGYLEGTLSSANAGKLTEAGLPNITGMFTTDVWPDPATQDGAFYRTQRTMTARQSGTGSNTANFDMNFDASRSNAVYGNSNTVQPQSISGYYYIVVGTSSKATNNIDTNIELNIPFVLLEGKYFETPVYNASWLISDGTYNLTLAGYPSAYNALSIEYNQDIAVGTVVNNYIKRGLPVKLSTDTYTDYDFVWDTNGLAFRPPLKINQASSRAVIGNGMTLGLTNGSQNGGLYGYTGNNIKVMTAVLNAYGTNVGTGNSDNGIVYSLGVTDDPTKSGIETSDSNVYLYFYVGETLTNANLVNVNSIFGRLDQCLTRSNKEEITGWGMPNYSAGINKANNTQYTADTDGHLIVFWSNASGLTVTINGTALGYSANANTQGWYCSVGFLIKKGSTYKVYASAGAMSIRFYPMV